MVKTVNNIESGCLLSVHDFKKMILGASYFFEREKERINALNVFPVPDGDTGTNMSMTLNAAVESAINYKGKSIGELSNVVASQALMGARGNSGVILSQILKGIAHGLKRKDSISTAELSKAFQYGVVYAYKAVSTPVEGTILTVAREVARGIRNAVRKGENLHKSMEEAIKSGNAALEKTTDMLPALKEAGVVDAGGLGLLVFLEGCLYAMKQSLNDLMHHSNKEPSEAIAVVQSNLSKHSAGPLATDKLNLLHPYCTEMLVKNETGNFNSLKDKLLSHGDSLVVAIDHGIAKIHIHTASPDLVLQTALQYGTLHDIKIENMVDQHEQTASSTMTAEKPSFFPNIKKQDKGKTGVISVSFGEGFREIFLSLGTDKIIFGGQTMNPTVEDLLSAVQNIPQQSVIILPNNKNIVMVAEQVKALADKQVEVVETRTLPEGLAALLAYNIDQPIADNTTSMKKAINRVKTGSVTHATRDTVIKGMPVKTGHYLGLFGEEIVSSNQELDQAALELAREVIEKDNDIITIFYGQDIPRDKASLLAAALEESHPDLEVELQYGGQPIYYYIFSVE